MLLREFFNKAQISSENSKLFDDFNTKCDIYYKMRRHNGLKNKTFFSPKLLFLKDISKAIMRLSVICIFGGSKQFI